MIRPAHPDKKCEFCNDEDALHQFGEYGKGIGRECLKALRMLINGQCGACGAFYIEDEIPCRCQYED